MPYITASIILLSLKLVVPTQEKLQKEVHFFLAAAKLQSGTRYLTFFSRHDEGEFGIEIGANLLPRLVSQPRLRGLFTIG